MITKLKLISIKSVVMKNCKNCLANNTWFDIYLINTVANNYKIKLFISAVQLLIVQLAASI